MSRISRRSAIAKGGIAALTVSVPHLIVGQDSDTLLPPGVIGVGQARQLPKDERKETKFSLEDVIIKRPSVLEVLNSGGWVTHTASGLGHNPPNRGRSVGDYWRDYCDRTDGHACFGPYVTLDPGVYEYYYEIEFEIPRCGGANNTIVFRMDSVYRPEGGVLGTPIPGSRNWVLRWNNMCDEADEHNIFRGSWGGTFATDERLEKVEMRFNNDVTAIGGRDFEVLLKQLKYRKR